MSDLQKVSQKAQEFRKREADILKCAQVLFIDRGEDTVTVEMIADAANIGKGTVYKHFETKDEICLRLLIGYEEELADMFKRLEESDQAGQLARAYFSFRMQEPEKYALFYRLERKLTLRTPCTELLKQLHAIRAENLEKLAASIQIKIDDDTLEAVPPNFHLFAAWALVHGTVELYHSQFFQDYIGDKDGFFSFMEDIGLHMGVKRKS